MLRGGEKTLGRAGSLLRARVVRLAMDPPRRGLLFAVCLLLVAGKQLSALDDKVLLVLSAFDGSKALREDAPVDPAGFHFVPLPDLRVAISTRPGFRSYTILRREVSRRYWPSVQVFPR